MEMNRQMLARVLIQGAGMAQRWEHLPSTNVSRVRLLFLLLLLSLFKIILNMELVVLHHYSGEMQWKTALRSAWIMLCLDSVSLQ